MLHRLNTWLTVLYSLAVYRVNYAWFKRGQSSSTAGNYALNILTHEHTFIMVNIPMYTMNYTIKYSFKGNLCVVRLIWKLHYPVFHRQIKQYQNLMADALLTLIKQLNMEHWLGIPRVTKCVLPSHKNKALLANLVILLEMLTLKDVISWPWSYCWQPQLSDS